MSAPTTNLPMPTLAQDLSPELPPGAEVLVLTSLDVGEAERQLIVRALDRTANNRTAAAALLGMHPRTLRRKLRAMNFTPDRAARTDD